MESLGKIFGSNHRVKIMRLFLFNGTTAFDIDDIISRSRVKKTDARKELALLLKIGFIKKKSFTKKIPKAKKKGATKVEYKSVKKQGWVLNKSFEIIKPLKNLLIDSELIKEKEIIKHIKKSGSIKLLILSGLFTGDDNRKLDVLIVGNKIKKDVLEKEVAIIESEIGRELQYTFFEEEEFLYRMSMYDKLLRDIIENEHIKLINKILYL